MKFDSSQPHGPGLMGISITLVRCYPTVNLCQKDHNSKQQQQHACGHHAGMVVHKMKRILYIANHGKGTVVAVCMDRGWYSRTARDEYPIFWIGCPALSIPSMSVLSRKMSL